MNPLTSSPLFTVAVPDGKIGRQHGRRGPCKHCVELSPLCRLNLSRLPVGFPTVCTRFGLQPSFQLADHSPCLIHGHPAYPVSRPAFRSCDRVRIHSFWSVYTVQTFIFMLAAGTIVFAVAVFTIEHRGSDAHVATRGAQRRTMNARGSRAKWKRECIRIFWSRDDDAGKNGTRLHVFQLEYHVTRGICRRNWQLTATTILNSPSENCRPEAV